VELRAHARRSLWTLRFLQAAALAVVVGGVLFLTGQAEGLAPWPLAGVGACVAFLLVLVAAPPWIAPQDAIDPAADPDGLLRTVLSEGLEAHHIEGISLQVQGRPLRFRSLPEWQAWVLLLVLGAAAGGWTLMEPEGGSGPLVRSELDQAGFGLDGESRSNPQGDPSTMPGEFGQEAPEAAMEDGGDGPERGEWRSVPDASGAAAVRQDLDLGLEQGVYERYLRNRARRP